jgi:16S rRNA (uracil1498-N3)-methyltransferase
MHLFYTPDIHSAFYTFGKDDSRHCSKVLRLNQGDRVTLTNGKGSFYHSEIIDDNPKATAVKVVEQEEVTRPWPQHIHLAIAPTKNVSRTEWAVEKCTEMGVDEITPVRCHHSERTILKHERTERIITAAVKQSLKAWHPVLNEMIPLKTLLEKPFEGEKYIAYIDKKNTDLLVNMVTCKNDVLILIGPEGDFSEEEVHQAIAKGYKPVSLGNSRLRSETAAVKACSTIHFVNEYKQKQ